MTPKRLFVLNGVIAGGYGIALLVAADPILDVYGITPNPEGVYMARWFGLGLLAIGLSTWLARDAADAAGGQAVARALAVTYGIGVVLALWGTLFGPFQRAGLDRGGAEPAAGVGLRLVPTCRCARKDLTSAQPEATRGDAPSAAWRQARTVQSGTRPFPFGSPDLSRPRR